MRERPPAVTVAHHAGTPVGPGVPAIGTPTLTFFRKEVPVVTSIAPRFAAATLLTMPGAWHVAPAAAAALPAGLTGLMLLTVVLIAGVLLASAASAARGLVGALTELARLAAAMTSAMILTAVVVLTLLILLIHH